MKWIVLAIVVTIVPYTFLTLRYRKPGPAFEPYADMKNRANVIRLLSAGYQRIPLAAQRPSEPMHLGVSGAIFPAPGGVPADLTRTLVDAPLLPLEIVNVQASDSLATGSTYPIQFTCTLPDNKQQLAGAQLYVKEGEIVITPDFETIGGELLARTRENVVLIIVPAGTFKPGSYHVTLAGTRTSRAWTLQVH